MINFKSNGFKLHLKSSWINLGSFDLRKSRRFLNQCMYDLSCPWKEPFMAATWPTMYVCLTGPYRYHTLLNFTEPYMFKDPIGFPGASTRLSGRCKV
jgi:hypothetical protein